MKLKWKESVKRMKDKDLFRGKCKKGNRLKRMNLENVLQEEFRGKS